MVQKKIKFWSDFKMKKTVGNAMIEWLNTYIKPCDKASTYTSYFYCIQTILIFKPEYQTKFLDDLCEKICKI